MLLSLKNKISGWVAYLIVGLITVPFALWGINFYFQGGGDPLIGKVGDQEITAGQLQNAYLSKKRELEEAGKQVDSVNSLRNYILSALMRDRFIREEVNQNGYSVPQSVLASAIARDETFMSEDGLFDKDLFFAYLREANITLATFEARVSQHLLQNQVRGIIQESSFILKAEEEIYKRFFAQERDIRYVIVEAENQVKIEEVSAEDVEAHYNQHKGDLYMTPQQFKTAYIEVKVEDFADEVQNITQEDAKAFYEKNMEQFVYPEQRRIAHILFDTDKHGKAKTKKMAQEAHAKLQNGEDFATIVEQYSDDIATKDKAGELPEIEAEDLEEAIRDVVFALSEGDISEPISSDDGTHIFKLIEVLPYAQKSFVEVKDEVLKELKDAKMQELYIAKVSEIEETIFESTSIEEIAEKTISTLNKTDWETKKTLSFLENDEFSRYFFSQDILFSGQISPVVALDFNHSIVFRVFDRIDPEQKSMEEVEKEAYKRVQELQSRKKTEKESLAYAKKLREGKITMEKLAEISDAEIHAPGFIHREQEDIYESIINIAYRATPPEEGKKAYIAGRFNEAGDYVVIEFLAVRENPKLKEEAEDLGKEKVSIEEYNLVLQSLVGTIEHRIVEDQLLEETEKLKDI